MKHSDLDFVIESVILALDCRDLDGLQIMVDWGTEVIGGDQITFLDKVRIELLKSKKTEAVAILEDHVKGLSE